MRKYFVYEGGDTTGLLGLYESNVEVFAENTIALAGAAAYTVNNVGSQNRYKKNNSLFCSRSAAAANSPGVISLAMCDIPDEANKASSPAPDPIAPTRLGVIRNSKESEVYRGYTIKLEYFSKPPRYRVYVCLHHERQHAPIC